jgi:hypothetical protein
MIAGSQTGHPWPDFSKIFAIVHDREDHKPAIGGRTFPSEKRAARRGRFAFAASQCR